ncbi:amino acid ABC transporter permease [Actinomycetospora termitidis]|uniref:Amino acid ABC transporter permease n=1 Tax=Actinomycetospora termitidis TaxID=3053470 RepID=A0ABT7MHA0_9PSEU|nr:amino acid ABC transporter permease [Actinomycetospora sp. Odt1-22]MDL5160053.1 amino acid ABC transporter permease [Actinomycetospora sp. Odt1-22]
MTSLAPEITTDPSSGSPPPRTVGSRHVGRWVWAAVVVVLVVWALRSVALNPAFGWSTVGQYLFTTAVLRGLGTTLLLTFATTVVGFVLGIGLAAMRLSGNPVLSSVSWGYVWLFRSTPLLVQLLFWYNVGALYPQLSLGIPFGPTFFSVESVNLISVLVAALLGLILHEAAYAAEIVRGGILSVDAGQSEAAVALGMTRARVLRRIVLPQAMRSIIPATGNMVIGTLKGTSIVSVIAVTDLLYSVQTIYNRTYEIIPLLLVATVWYVILTSVLSVGQYYVERYYARGAERTLPPTPLQRLRKVVR